MAHPPGKHGTQDDTIGKRIGALIIDTIVLTVVLMAAFLVATFAVGGAGRAMAGAFLLVQLLAFVVSFGYFIVLEAMYGQTLGKKLLGVVVVTEDGGQIDWLDSIIRNVLRVVDALPTLYIVGLIAILLSDDGQRLGDIAGSTYVVETE